MVNGVLAELLLSKSQFYETCKVSKMKRIQQSTNDLQFQLSKISVALRTATLLALRSSYNAIYYMLLLVGVLFIVVLRVDLLLSL